MPTPSVLGPGPLAKLRRETDEEVDRTGVRTVRHTGEGAALTSRVDRQGRLLRQELLLENDVLIWQHGTRIRTGICVSGAISDGTQYDATPSRTRLDRARLACQEYRGGDKYIKHLARVVTLSAGLAMGGAEVVTHSDGGRRRRRVAEAEARRKRWIIGAGAAVAVALGAYLALR